MLCRPRHRVTPTEPRPSFGFLLPSSVIPLWWDNIAPKVPGIIQASDMEQNIRSLQQACSKLDYHVTQRKSVCVFVTFLSSCLSAEDCLFFFASAILHLTHHGCPCRRQPQKGYPKIDGRPIFAETGRSGCVWKPLVLQSTLTEIQC